ncbi:MAG: hypothetical protein HQM10_16655 [Candidatus Riflebacteria bacterium]|nr:hypothetical protein [Candidatus Riflebacteria bacterium]
MKKLFLYILLLFFVTFFVDKIIAFTEKSNLRFSHKTHADAKIKCELCHSDGSQKDSGWEVLKPSRLNSLPQITFEEPDVASSASSVASATAGTFGRPAESLCLSCHFKERKKSDCGLCHLGNPTKTYRERNRITLKPGFSHSRHKKADCLECHSDAEKWDSLDECNVNTFMTSCLKCHDGIKAKNACKLCHSPVPRPSDHGRNYERKHGTAYRVDPKSCRTCHEDSSCLSCHSRRPKDHTPAWVARRHGISAQSNPMKCEVCHPNNEVCSRCHGAK